MLPAILLVPLAIMASAGFGAVWGAIPGYLQAKRGSHIVITTIMFNFLAASIMVWLLAGRLKAPGRCRLKHAPSRQMQNCLSSMISPTPLAWRWRARH